MLAAREQTSCSLSTQLSQSQAHHSLVVIAVCIVALPHQHASQTVGIGRRQNAGGRKQNSSSGPSSRATEHTEWSMV